MRTKNRMNSNNFFSIEIEPPKNAKGIDPIRKGIKSFDEKLPAFTQFIEFPETTKILQKSAISGKI